MPYDTSLEMQVWRDEVTGYKIWIKHGSLKSGLGVLSTIIVSLIKHYRLLDNQVNSI